MSLKWSFIRGQHVFQACAVYLVMYGDGTLCFEEALPAAIMGLQLPDKDCEGRDHLQQSTPNSGNHNRVVNIANISS